MIEIHPLPNIPEIREGDNLTDHLGRALSSFEVHARDIVVVSQKIVSKAEGRMVSLSAVSPSDQATEIAAAIGKDPRLVELILAESSEIVRMVPGLIITRHRLGFVMANAGIDASNIGPGNEDRVLLLPQDPDRSAETIRAGLEAAIGHAPGILISDSFGRPWRHGVVNVAIGAAGIEAIHDWRGTKDRDGREMRATIVAAGDLVASAAGLVMGEAAEGIPAALCRGLDLTTNPRPASEIVRPPEEDLFR